MHRTSGLTREFHGSDQPQRHRSGHAHLSVTSAFTDNKAVPDRPWAGRYLSAGQWDSLNNGGSDLGRHAGCCSAEGVSRMAVASTSASISQRRR